jgi:non-ribosomal peptide synthetase component F
MPGEALSLRLGDLTVEEFVHDEATTMFDLNFMFSEGPRGLALEIAYSTALFESTTVERMGERLLHLLTVISEQPDITVRSLCDLFEKPMAALEKAEFLAAALNLDDEF